MPPSSLSIWQNAERFLRARQFDAARAGYEALLTDPDWRLPARLRLSSVALEGGRVRESVAQALAAYAARGDDPTRQNPVLIDALCKLLVDNGELQAAVDCASSPVLMQTDDPAILAKVGKLMSQQSFPELAARFLKRARQLGFDTPDSRHTIGLSELYAGDLDAARRELEACLQADPDFAPAWRDLARLRRQTDADNHVDDLRAAIARAGASRNAPLLHYTLFKELDDLGDTTAAWQALTDGMGLRRKQVQHDAAAEQALFEHLHGLRAESAKAPGEPAAESPAIGGPQPIFIVGMPRSGTTLLERILGAHSQVADAGELRDFNFQLRWICDRVGRPHLDLDLARRAEAIDWAQLGQRYLSHTQWHANDRPFYTDKLPANFINAGYIARALPQARILHMVRDPLDTCFSNLKELFGEAYPHSYDQIEMADHFLRYRRLMAHWHAQFPGRILDVHYDRLVADPEAAARQVLDFCDLPWEPEVVAIQSRRGAVATASATQIREPIHQRFVGQWRRYESQLQLLRERLETIEP